MKLKFSAILLCLLLLTSCSTQNCNQNSSTTEPDSNISEQNTAAISEEETIADDDYAAIAEKLALVICDETDTEKRLHCDSYIEEYLSYKNEEGNWANIGRCEDIYPDTKYITGGYAYVVNRSWEQNYFYYVNSDKKSVYSCIVDSDMYLCWKDGLIADETAAAEFAVSILGKSVLDSADAFYVDLDGYYTIYFFNDNSFHISWDMKQIFLSEKDSQEMHLIYPEDTIGYFLV